MPTWLVSLLAPMLATGVGAALGGGKSSQTSSSTTDPFYALMSPYTIGSLLSRFGALQGAGFPSGAIGMTGTNFLGNDIWKTIMGEWPKINKKFNTRGNTHSLSKYGLSDRG